MTTTVQTTLDSGVYGTDTIDLSSLTMSSVTSPYTVTGAIGTTVNTNFPNAIWTSNGTTSAPWMTHNPTGAKISLNGEAADIEINGWSLVDAVKRIEERLNLLQPNPKLETEWEELKQIGDQYRALEQQIKDKMATWAVLNRPLPDDLT